MTSIAPTQQTLTLNGKRLEGEFFIKPLAADVKMGEAKNLVNNRLDGLNTVGVRLGGQDCLILTRQPLGLMSTDQLQVDGQRAHIQFIEQEDTTLPGLGEKIGLAFGGGLLGTAFGGAAGFVGAMLFDHPLPLTLGLVGGAILGATAGATSSGLAILTPDHALTDSITRN